MRHRLGTFTTMTAQGTELETPIRYIYYNDGTRNSDSDID